MWLARSNSGTASPLTAQRAALSPTAIREDLAVFRTQFLAVDKAFTAPARAVWAVRLKTDVAVDFWRQFRAHFRSRQNETFAWCERTPTELVLDSYAAMELANHLAIKLLHDPEVPEIATWREINERYIVGPDAWYVETLTRHGLRVLAYTVDDEPEHRAAVGAHLALAQLRAGGQAVPLSPPCGRFNLLLEKAGAQPG